MLKKEAKRGKKGKKNESPINYFELLSGFGRPGSQDNLDDNKQAFFTQRCGSFKSAGAAR